MKWTPISPGLTLPKPWKEPYIQNKIRHWVEENPDRWYTTTYEEIHIETGVSRSSLFRYFPLIVAQAAGILPSEVKAKRWQAGGFRKGLQGLRDVEIAEIQRLYAEGNSTFDISFMTGWSMEQIAKYKPRPTQAEDEEPTPPQACETDA